MAPFVFNLRNQVLSLLKLQMHELDCLLQHNALAATLALETRHQFREPVEAFADGCATLLLRRDVVVFLLLIGEAGFVFFLTGSRLRSRSRGR